MPVHNPSLYLLFRRARRCFAWSRCFGNNGASPAPGGNHGANLFSDRGISRFLYLPFEGFLEALCRVAAIKALPTDEELTEAGMLHAPAFLNEMRETRPGEYEQFLLTRGGTWGGRLRQPLHKALGHLLNMIVAGCVPQRRVDGAEPLPPLTEKECIVYCRTFDKD